jgi:preprotein translocase subunit Sec61beta
MAEKDKMYMPQSTAGLIRYFEAEEALEIKPSYVILISVLFGGLVLFLRFLA